MVFILKLEKNLLIYYLYFFTHKNRLKELPLTNRMIDDWKKKKFEVYLYR